MFLYFIVFSIMITAEIFKSIRLDYRLVGVGSVIPLVTSISFIPNLGHTLIFSVFIFTLILVFTMQKRLIRRQLIGLVIGLFLHLILDGTWMNKFAYWWPIFGGNIYNLPSPEINNFPQVLLLDGLALIFGYYLLNRYGLNTEQGKKQFYKNGNLSRIGE